MKNACKLKVIWLTLTEMVG